MPRFQIDTPYLLDPDAEGYHGGPIERSGVTAVEVQGGFEEPDSDGEVFVRTLDGSNPGACMYVRATDLEPYDFTESATLTAISTLPAVMDLPMGYVMEVIETFLTFNKGLAGRRR